MGFVIEVTDFLSFSLLWLNLEVHNKACSNESTNQTRAKNFQQTNLESDVCIDVVSIFVNVSGDDSRSLGGLEVGSCRAAKPHRFNIAILFKL